MTRKFISRLIMVAGVLVAIAALHWTRLDCLAWYAWKITFLPQEARIHAADLMRYRVDIEGRPLKGVDDDVSALTYNPERDTLFTVLNNKPLIVELTLEGLLLRQIRVIGARDLEGMTYVAQNRYVIAEERKQRLWVVSIDDDTHAIDLNKAPGLTLAIDIFKNRGFEGLAYDERAKRLLVVKESHPPRVLAITGFVEPDPHMPLDIRITEVISPHSPALFVTDLSSLTMHEPSGHLLLLGDQSKLVVEYDADGTPISMLPLWRGFGGLKSSVPQAEGIATDNKGRIYIVSEPNLFYRFSRH